MVSNLPERMRDLSFRTPLLLLGLAYYPINRMSDMAIKIPVGDALLPLVLLLMAVRAGKLGELFKLPAAWLGAGFLGWVVLANFVNGLGVGEQARMIYVLSTLLLPVFCFMVLPPEQREKLMHFMIGVVLGFGLYFIVLALPEVVQGQLSRSLRGSQPTPVVAFAVWAMFRHRLSPLLQLALWATIVFSIMVGIGVQARGPLVAVVMMFGFCALMRYSPKKETLTALALSLCLMAHWFIAFITPGWFYDTVTESEFATISNRERAFLIDYCMMMLRENPFFGISFKVFAEDFAGYFAWLSSWEGEGAVHSPHNSFLEYATFYGYPGAFLFLATLFVLVRNGLRQTANLWVAAAVAAGLVRLGAFYGFSGWLRIEWFALLFLLYYSTQKISAKPSAPPQ